MHDDLTDLHRAILDFEAHHWPRDGSKDAAIRDRFEVSPTRYYAVLIALIRRTDALAYAPLTVKRLRRLEDARRAVRVRASVGGRA